MNLPESALVLSAAKLHSVISVGSKNLAVSVSNGALDFWSDFRNHFSGRL